MSKFSDFVDKVDKKVNPNIGYLLHRIFFILTLVLIFVALPLIVLIVGSFAVVGNIPNETAAICAGIIPWLVLLISSSILWFYFSKWIVNEEESEESEV